MTSDHRSTGNDDENQNRHLENTKTEVICRFSVSGSQWDRVVQFIATHHQSVLLPPYTMTMTLYIPTISVGAVIGRRGQTVAALQKTAAQSASTHQPVRVSVVAATKEGVGGGHESLGTTTLNAGVPSSTVINSSVPSSTTTTTSSLGMSPTLGSPMGSPGGVMTAASAEYHTFTPLDQSDPAWTPVVIRADAPAACHAAQGLADLLAKAAPASSKAPTSVETMSLLLDQVILDVPIPRQKHAALIGKRGITVATLSSESTVRIMIPQKTSRLDLIQLEGDLLNVLVCLANLMSLLVSPSESSSAANNNNTASPTSHNATATTTTSTTTTTVSLTALPSQTKLRNIARKTDCQIRKQRRSNTLTITGQTLDQVQSAVQLLDKWQTAQQQQASDGEEAAPAASSNHTNHNSGGGGGNRNNRRGGNNRNRNGKRNYKNNNSNNNNNKDSNNSNQN